jgi:hypothetical protein
VKNLIEEDIDEPIPGSGTIVTLGKKVPNFLRTRVELVPVPVVSQKIILFFFDSLNKVKTIGRVFTEERNPSSSRDE